MVRAARKKVRETGDGELTFNEVCVCVCSSASNRIIGAKDHASIQINIAEVRAGQRASGGV